MITIDDAVIRQHKALSKHLRQLVAARVKQGSYQHLRNPCGDVIAYQGIRKHRFRVNIMSRWPVQFNGGKNNLNVGYDENVLMVHAMPQGAAIEQGLYFVDGFKSFRSLTGRLLCDCDYWKRMHYLLLENKESWKRQLNSGSYAAFVDDVLARVDDALARFKEDYSAQMP